MTSKPEVPKLIQLSLNEDEAMLIAWSLYLSLACYAGKVEGQIRGLNYTGSYLRDMGPEKHKLLTDRIETLVKAAYPDVKDFDPETEKLSGLDSVIAQLVGLVDPRAKPDCPPHCSCSDDTCCWCGKSKSALSLP